VSALDIVEKMRAEHSVLLVPGEHFGTPGFLRFGYGEGLQHFRESLAETERGLKRILF
jgi:aspartate/methionine/tyrosine aminotransferase